MVGLRTEISAPVSKRWRSCKFRDLLIVGHVQLLLVAMGAHALDVAAFCAGGNVKGMGAHRDKKKLEMSMTRRSRICRNVSAC